MRHGKPTYSASLPYPIGPLLDLASKSSSFPAYHPHFSSVAASAAASREASIAGKDN
jgi:hypothetical protein